MMSDEASWQFITRFLELVKGDKELHDATVKLVNAVAEDMEIKNKLRKRKIKPIICNHCGAEVQL